MQTESSESPSILRNLGASRLSSYFRHTRQKGLRKKKPGNRFMSPRYAAALTSHYTLTKPPYEVFISSLLPKSEILGRKKSTSN